jgi:hypothetical protein
MSNDGGSMARSTVARFCRSWPAGVVVVCSVGAVTPPVTWAESVHVIPVQGALAPPTRGYCNWDPSDGDIS